MDALLEHACARQSAGRDDWAVEMQWRNLLFCHWPFRPRLLRPLAPAALEIDTFDGWAWIGIVPFHLTIRYRWMPLALSFPEVNVRTYVRRGDERGVWFLSLDAQSRLAAEVARWRHKLPYHPATIQMRALKSANPTVIHFESHRRSIFRRRSAVNAELKIDYSPRGEDFAAGQGSLEHWLVEHYQLFTADRRGRIARGRIDHAPWQLHSAEAEIATNSMLEPLGLALPDRAPLAHFSSAVNCIAWKLQWEQRISHRRRCC